MVYPLFPGNTHNRIDFSLEVIGHHQWIIQKRNGCHPFPDLVETLRKCKRD